ncbi:MAG: succinate dehydrogenase assembly factor 2 [Gammaproteobacteria bacterium]|nr:succinate dehydrogenase assembly factor 2 [Gammaproteobacteria bacterium]MCW8840988.1 succinate dehydrogenase assembly factor 2 [Gammaproteobacteria bacterium]MCW8958711.1 succinate dehydrogenase assembly factor 2 [Gammaproteobacteria bacterium]MCW8974004.1 succinate dehydrogenase assembly factor 2 [Gammaproteobacteria bacterium]MCW8993522.1 succinate dehydrogenase assembly factor 2 [Gammaproteobacteria bacterium]
MTGEEAALSRLRWRCRRGMLELDLLLQGFLDSGYTQLEAAQREQFAAFLALSDQQLYDYLLGNVPPDEKEFIDVIERIRHAASH